MVAETHFIEIIIGVGILLFAAKLMAELVLKLKLPIVLGELLAGIIIGPYALGGFFIYNGASLVEITDEIKILGQIGALVILFMAGLQMTPKEFLKGGKAAFIVATGGVAASFFVGFVVFQMFGFEALQSMLIATALTATSIAITVQVLNEFGKIKTPEARLIIGAAVIDDILAIALLSVVLSIAGNGEAIQNIDITKIIFTMLQVLGFFAIMLVVTVLVIPKFITPRLWKAKGSVEGIATASFFGAAGLAGLIGLSPIVGAFAVGMALSAGKIFEKIQNYIEKMGLIFAPLFFVIIGAQVDLRAVNLEIIALGGGIIAVAVVTKFGGCGLPAMYFLKSKTQGMKVGIGMIAKGEVSLIVAGAGIATGILTSNVYSTIVIMVAATTIITPIWLKIEYGRELRGHKSHENTSPGPSAENNKDMKVE